MFKTCIQAEVKEQDMCSICKLNIASKDRMCKLMIASALFSSIIKTSGSVELLRRISHSGTKQYMGVKVEDVLKYNFPEIYEQHKKFAFIKYIA